jgi:hypothetical protein
MSSISVSKATQGRTVLSSTDTDKLSGALVERECSLDYTKLKEGVYRRVGMTANEMRCKAPDLYEYDRDYLKPLWRLLLDGVLICNDALRCGVLYTAIASHDDPPMEKAVEKAVETWSRQIRYICHRAYWDIDLPDEKTGKERSQEDKRMCAIEGLEIIEENLKWFVGFIRGYVESSDAADAVPFQHDGLDRIARKTERFLADSAELKKKALEAK